MKVIDEIFFFFTGKNGTCLTYVRHCSEISVLPII